MHIVIFEPTSVHSALTNHILFSLDWRVHNNAIFDIEWVPQSNNILTGSGDQTILLTDVTTETKICTFKGHKSSVKNVDFAPDSLGKLNFSVIFHAFFPY